ncbi:hypothetical protein BTZ20_4467 [Rhodococcus sp. MTM3W5.2]|uniref:hypothetical protein n=1 Tax=Rhodococcus sp. MTM3W5.2 TaxID=1805827 RepID=UPI00097964E6|nr:hypothetical protein [Rhodococcus sp. MTM3W5.2]AQA22759.1 hypothetical protein BTZ20_4467 [Rhodococcus sp. MTM3W5.2]
MPENTDDQLDAEHTTDLPELTETPPSLDEAEDPDTFDRAYVEKLRDENAKYRQRAGRADELSQRLHTALVAATGRLADPMDLVFDPEHLESDEALTAAIDELLTRKAHLASRKPVGDVGQGVVPTAESVSLAGLLRSRAI